MSRRAVVVGIDRYLRPVDGTESSLRDIPDLQGAAQDALSIARLLEHVHGFEVRILLDEAATRDAILKAVELHLTRGAGPDDDLVFFFAGHGTQVRNSRSIEPDGLDEALVPTDGARGAPALRDKELRRIFNKPLDRGARLTILLDSCHSGSGVRGLPSRRVPRFTSTLDYDVADGRDPGPELERAALIITAAQDFEGADEIAVEYPPARGLLDTEGRHRGAFTLALLKALANRRQESVARTFGRIRSLLMAEGLAQRPTLAGPKERLALPLFGTAEDILTAPAVGVLGEEADGTLLLDGGWVSGLSPGTELRLVESPAGGGEQADEESDAGKSGHDGPRWFVVKSELTRSRARAAAPSIPAPRPSTLLEVSRWAVPTRSRLRMAVSAIDAPPKLLLQLMQRVQDRLRGLPTVTWVEDPVATPPSHELSWREGSWRLADHYREIANLGPRLDPERLAELLTSLSFKVDFFAHVPWPTGLGEPAEERIVDVVSDSQDGTFTLVGRLRGGRLSFNWIRIEAGGPEGASASLPASTPWSELGTGPLAPYDLGYRVGRQARELARIYGWLHLNSPNAGFFPYRLGLRLRKSNEVRTDGRLFGGEVFDLVLVATPEVTDFAIEPRFIYAFSLDSRGRSTLIYPQGILGSVGNCHPEPAAHKGRSPEFIPLGEAATRFRVREPWGVDTFFLLTTSDPLPNPWVLDTDAIRNGLRPMLGEHPLEALLLDMHAQTRSPSDNVQISPVVWSIDKEPFLVLETAP